MLGTGIDVPEKSTALYRGRISIRPWRVGVLVDVDDADQVVRAITQLSEVWGGLYMPILDVNADLDTLRAVVRLFDVDSVYAENASKELEEFLRASHLGWRGRGQYGPFGSEGGLKTGLLPAAAPAAPNDFDTIPWQGPIEPTIALAAYLGRLSSTDGPERTRPIGETTRLLDLATHFNRPAPRGFAVMRDGVSRDVVWFWNSRGLSNAIYPLLENAEDFNTAVLADVTDVDVFTPASPGGAKKTASGRIPVWGFEDLTAVEQRRLEAWAAERHLQVEPNSRDHALGGTWFPGFERIASNKFRAEARPAARLIAVDIPPLALRDPTSIYPGIVAAELDFHEASGVDPRLTVTIPPHRRHAALIDRLGYGADQTRISSVGPVFGTQANLEELSVPNAYQLDVMRLLFDNEEVVIGQSDEGKFQTRAAEIFGGPLAGHLAQPGVRAAIREAGTKLAGITLSQLTNVVTSQRGDWPDPLRAFHETPQQYAERQVHLLLNSGMLVPSLHIQCHECRISLLLSPEQLGTTVECEFCGADVRLALALALTKPEWRFRLAGHLSASRVEAFLPAMAASAVLSGLHHVEGPPASHVFGLEIQLPNRRQVEVDIAMIMHEDGWVVVLGEVKNHKPIDSNDVGNLFALCAALIDKGIPAIPLFATFNAAFSQEERQAIRLAMDAGPQAAFIRGQRLPLTPLLLTRRDMSLPNFHDDHPWRWPNPGTGTGVVGVALESSKRHLGLLNVTWQGDAYSRPRFEWEPLSADADDRS